MTTKTSEKTYLTDLHRNHVEWVSALTFYKEDLKTFIHRLEEIVAKNNHQDVLSKVEHFQNQFIIQRNEIDVLLHDIKLKEKELVDYAASHPVAIDHVRFQESTELVARMNRFEDLWKELRSEYLTFVSKWM